MLEEMTIQGLKTRYENLVNFNNTIMKKIDELRDHIHKAGKDHESLFMLKDYQYCSYIVISENKEFTREDLIEACRSIEIVLDTINRVHDYHIISYRTHVPINRCKKCDHNVTVSYKMDMRFKTCQRCGDTTTNIGMIKIG